MIKLSDFITETLHEIYEGVNRSNRENNKPYIHGQSIDFELYVEVNNEENISGDAKGGFNIGIAQIGSNVKGSDKQENKEYQKINFSVIAYQHKVH